VYSAHDDDIRMTVHTFSGSVLRLAFAYLKCRADAEDVAQEVFLAYAFKRPRYGSEPQKKAWLLRVTANKCKNQLKAARRRSTVPLSESVSALPDKDNELLSVVFALDEKYRIPIHLHYYEGYSIAEIAQLMRAKPATVGTWLARGRSLLKAMIGDDPK
jgi:RNA polymerase sigma-70 factor (ECF subfamily)